MSDTKINEITIIPIKPKNGLVALASCVLDDKLYLGSVGIYTRLKGGYRLTYPNKKIGGSAVDIFHPINKQVGEDIEQAIIAEYEKLMNDNLDEQQEGQHEE